MKRIKTEGSLNQGEWNTPGKKRPRKPVVSNLDDFDVSAIRTKINDFYCVRKQVPTLRTLLVELRESIEFSGCRETLRQILLKNSFELKKNMRDLYSWKTLKYQHGDINTFVPLMKRGNKVNKLYTSMRHMSIRINKVKKSWQGPSTSGVVDKISPGKRHIIIHAGSEKGCVPNALLVYSTKSKMADYHDDMNHENFMRWLGEKLIPNLKEPSVIIMDNASYHVTQINKPPTINNLKSEIQKWLIENDISFGQCFTKAELLCLVKITNQTRNMLQKNF